MGVRRLSTLERKDVGNTIRCQLRWNPFRQKGKRTFHGCRFFGDVLQIIYRTGGQIEDWSCCQVPPYSHKQS